MAKPILSICITVYNQLNLVSECIRGIIEYEFDDIEVVISDDKSKDDIRSLVLSFNDSRIKYYCGTENKGHDLNILSGLQNCSGEYALLLRSRDRITRNQIKDVISVIKSNKTAVYFLFTAIDEKENVRMLLSDKRYSCGRQTIKANNKLLIHPSGQVYRLDQINFNIIEKSIRTGFDDKYGFIAHTLIRTQLSMKGDFVTSSKVGWIYSNTGKAKDVAQNSGDKGISVYAPLYEYRRYRCEYLFVLKSVEENYLLVNLTNIVKRFYRSVCIDFENINRNKQMQKHYNYNQIEYSSQSEWKKFYHFSTRLFDEGKIYRISLRLFLVLIRLFFTPIYKIKGIVLFLFGNNRFFPYIYKKYKHL